MGTAAASGIFRWLSNDPIDIFGGLNQYVFCANNPLRFVDPLGLCNDPWYKKIKLFCDFSGSAGVGANWGVWGGGGGTLVVDPTPVWGWRDSLAVFGHIDGGFTAFGGGGSLGPSGGLIFGAQDMEDVQGLGTVAQLDLAALLGISVTFAASPDLSIWTLGVGPSGGADVSGKVGTTGYTPPFYLFHFCTSP